jgi:hypothetical protein
MYGQISDPVERRARLTGEFTWYAGKIYPDYGDRHRIDFFKPPSDWELIVAIDPHPTKETAVTYCWWSPQKWAYFMDELWVGGSVDHIVAKIKERCHFWRKTPNSMLIDPASDHDEKIHAIESIYQKFVNHFPDIIKWTSHPGSVWMGIEDVREYIRINAVTDLPRIFVCNEYCPMIDWQLAHYGLKPPSQADKVRYSPQPVQVKDDFADCVRGTIMFGYPDWKTKPLTRFEDEDKFGIRDYDG